MAVAKRSAPLFADIVPTIQDLAALFGVNKSCIDAWIKQGKLAPSRSPLISHIQTYYATSKGTSGNGDGALTREKIRTEKARADKLETQVDRLRWETVPVADVERAIIAALSELRTNLLSLPNDIGQEIASVTDVAECVEIVRERVHAAMTCIAESAVDAIVTEALQSADEGLAEREDQDSD